MLRKNINSESNVHSTGSVPGPVASSQLDPELSPPSVILYTLGLKAMVDVLPDNTDMYSAQTVGSYLWVIEQLLVNIYSLLGDAPGVDVEKILMDISGYTKNMPLSVVYGLSPNQPES
ncbi:hypothetical protein MNBD_GAMMA11-1706 [hydrothermal vent metagenome]|uniref:Uncharacterized protein n=1 Tax=hydrothermal vent metagenome TaxID=652676 RepID=A0A3B0X532_9ZZZZ